VSLYASLAPTALNYGRTLLDSLHERVGEQAWLVGRSDIGGRDDALEGLWARAIYVDGEHDGETGGIYGGGPGYDYRFRAIQLGLDLYQNEEAGNHADRAGMYAVAGYAEGDVFDPYGNAAGTNRADGLTLGAYWTRYGAAERRWYLDGVLQATWYDARSQSNDRDMPALQTEGMGFTASIEGGYPFPYDNGWQLEPQAQLDYSWMDLDDSSDIGADVRFDDLDSLVGRLSARLSRDWTHHEDPAAPRQTSAWTRLSVRHEFRGDPVTSFSSANGWVPFHAEMGGTWWELEVGLTREVGRNVFFYGNLGYLQGWDDDRRAWEGKAGVRANW
jgi:outer membrane autotransporter protein